MAQTPLLDPLLEPPLALFLPLLNFFSTLDILQSTLGVAFREVIPQFNLYFKHIHSLVHSLGNACLWTDVVQYDA